ncbi:hypothetical protein K438DRAFT_2037054, partial [Mycena galopus ATCC 62051]
MRQSSGNNAGMWTSSHSIGPQGARSSSASAYYEPNKSKPNLTGAQATRILFSSYADPSGNLIASGVEYHKDGQFHRVLAEHDVLLCAGESFAFFEFTFIWFNLRSGSFKSPQLLELSGAHYITNRVIDAC